MKGKPVRGADVKPGTDIAARECLLRFKRNGHVLAVASIFRDVESLRAEVSMERDTPT